MFFYLSELHLMPPLGNPQGRRPCGSIERVIVYYPERLQKMPLLFINQSSFICESPEKGCFTTEHTEYTEN
jgi:hypothetical protein